MMEVTKAPSGEVLIRLRGAFDAGAAARLAGRLVEIPLDGALVLDFTQVRVCEDFGLAALAEDLSARVRLIVRGLTRHQERMLRYLGVRLGTERIAREALDAVG